MLLLALDRLSDAVHIAVILFNLSGWAFAATRRAHRWLVCGTAFFWLAIGPFIGTVGFCPLTEIQARIKEARGIHDYPRSYIDYLLQGLGIHADPDRIDLCTGIAFGLILLATGWAWRQDRHARRGA